MDIRVLRFQTKINRTGKAVDWVLYAPAHGIGNMETWARVKDLMPPAEFDEDRDIQGTKMAHMRAVWSQIEPKYEAWKKGADMPENGTPLSAWPGISEEEVHALNRVQVRSVEELAEMGDSALDRVALPNTRSLREQAKKFIAAAATAQTSEAIEALQAKLAEQAEQLEAALALLAERSETGAEAEDKPRRGRPPKAKAEAEAA